MAPRVFQTTFFSRLAVPASMRAIFKHIPEVYVFTQNRRSRMVAASLAIPARQVLRGETEFIGERDHEVVPRHRADAFVADDAHVFHTVKPIVNLLELWLNEQRRPEWCITSRIPLFGQPHDVVGLMGESRRDAGQGSVFSASEITRTVDLIPRNVSRILTVAEAAEVNGISERTLHRQVRQESGIPPDELALRIRIQLAAEALLTSSEGLAAIGNAHGFCDQSSCILHFCKRMGMTPKDLISRHRQIGHPVRPINAAGRQTNRAAMCAAVTASCDSAAAV